MLFVIVSRLQGQIRKEKVWVGGEQEGEGSRRVEEGRGQTLVFFGVLHFLKRETEVFAFGDVELGFVVDVRYDACGLYGWTDC